VLLPKSLKYDLGVSDIKRECPGDVCWTCNDGPAMETRGTELQVH